MFMDVLLGDSMMGHVPASNADQCNLYFMYLHTGGHFLPSL